MVSFLEWDAERNGDSYALVYFDIWRQHRLQAYPAVKRGVWYGTECKDVTIARIPVEYGTIRPFTAYDLCVYLWFDGGWATETNGRVILYQTTIVTRDPDTSCRLDASFVVFTYETRRGELNHHLAKCGIEWYGDVLIMQLNNGEIVNVKPEYANTFLCATTRLMRKGGLTQKPSGNVGTSAN